MPKPKRSTREQIERYKRKLQDLECAEVKKKRRRRLPSSNESDHSDQGESQHNVLEMHTDGHGDESPPEPENHELPSPDDVLITPAAEPDAPVMTATPVTPAESAIPAAPAALTTPAPDNTQTPAQPAPPVVDQPSLDPTLLAALGELTSDTPDYGTSIHDSLANIWIPLLKKGMTKESRDKLLKEYLIPNNCKLLQAPKLNAEISAAVSEVVRGRDKKYVAVQQQLGQAISAVSRAMDVLLKTDDKIEALKYLSDGCRMLSDSHYFLTKDRIKLITPSLEKNFLHVIQDAERDESLFGNALSEKIKASKAIERQGQQIKKNISAPKANTSYTTNTRASTSQGNWSGPPRYSSNRGGRGGNRKTNPPPATRRPYINTAATTRPPAQGKTRASTHQ